MFYAYFHFFCIFAKSMEKVQVQIVGLNEVKSSEEVYWLLFKEVNGERHAPILIGKTEAQAILVSLQNVKIPVKLTHQLFAEVTRNFGVKLSEIVICDTEDKLFSANLTWKNDAESFVTTARASDGVALALCYGRPIYMETKIFDKLEDIVAKNVILKTEITSEEDLQKELTQAIADENYELAAQLRDQLKEIKNQ